MLLQLDTQSESNDTYLFLVCIHFPHHLTVEFHPLPPALFFVPGLWDWPVTHLRLIDLNFQSSLLYLHRSPALPDHLPKKKQVLELFRSAYLDGCLRIDALFWIPPNVFDFYILAPLDGSDYEVTVWKRYAYNLTICLPIRHLCMTKHTIITPIMRAKYMIYMNIYGQWFKRLCLYTSKCRKYIRIIRISY